MSKNRVFWVAVALFALKSPVFSASIEENFREPPSAAKPRTWMHVMSGNMNEKGLSKDVKAIHDAGIGGIMVFNIANMIPYGETEFNSPEHHSLLKHLAAECERYDLSFGHHNCDGWTSSGGPYIKPEDSMKSVVWSKVLVEGGKRKRVALPAPASREGFYRDIAIVAYPSLKSEIEDSAAKPIITASEKEFNCAALMDGVFDQAYSLRGRGGEQPWVLLDYRKLHTVRSVLVHFHDRKGMLTLESSDDGTVFNKVVAEKNIRPLKGESAFDIQVKPVTARYFRLSFDRQLKVAEVELEATQLVDNYRGLNGSAKPHSRDYERISKPDPDMIVNRKSIVNLSGKMNKRGQVEIDLPEGFWTVFRFGYTSTGAKNWPATKWGLGLECDKFSKKAVRKQFDGFSKKLVDNVKTVAPTAMQYIEVDSYEVGGQNWTDGFERIFLNSKGYDLIPFLPVFAGRYIDSYEVTRGFIWDLNTLFTDLMTQNYYQYMTELCHENGVMFYNEPYGNGHIKTLDVCGVIDVPMGEFWFPGFHSAGTVRVVSGAHIYGKNVVSAEAFTSNEGTNWKGHPGGWKADGDAAWAYGINEFVFHRYAHQANTHVMPGMTMGSWGSHIDRTQHWWMNAGKSWFEYLARGTYLLQAGIPVADVLLFVGDGPFETFGGAKPPSGIKYDYINADALINRVHLQGNRMLLPEGNSYAALVLNNTESMELCTLAKIKEIADAGVPVFGERPLMIPGNGRNENDDRRFKEMVEYIWGLPNCAVEPGFSSMPPDLKIVGSNVNFVHRQTEHEDIYFFRNESQKQMTCECVFRIANKIPEIWQPETGEIIKIARFVNEGEFTRAWISLDENESAFVVFRESSDDIASIVMADDSHEYFYKSSTNMTMLTGRCGLHRVALSNGKTVEVEVERIPDPIDLNQLWNVGFVQMNKDEFELSFDKLIDFKEHEDERVKYFSGTATYSRAFLLPEKPARNVKAFLDLGELHVAAEVLVNGEKAGVSWVSPYRIEISDYLVEGENRLEIRVVNQWTNQLIGQEKGFDVKTVGYQPSGYVPDNNSKMPDWYVDNLPMPADPGYAFDAGQFVKRNNGKNRILISAGLLGPVQLRFAVEVDLSEPQ